MCAIATGRDQIGGPRDDLTLLRPGDYMMELDLEDAYFMVPIHEQHKRYFRLEFQSRTYEFKCLSFGLSSAPRGFTKLLKPFAPVLRASGIRIVNAPELREPNDDCQHGSHLFEEFRLLNQEREELFTPISGTDFPRSCH